MCKIVSEINPWPENGYRNQAASNERDEWIADPIENTIRCKVRKKH